MSPWRDKPWDCALCYLCADAEHEGRCQGALPVWKAKKHSWQEMEVLQGSTGMDVELLPRTWTFCKHLSDAPALCNHPCFSHVHKSPRLLLRCCCIGAPSSAGLASYSDSQKPLNKYTDMEASCLGSWICKCSHCFPECKGALNNNLKKCMEW